MNQAIAQVYFVPKSWNFTCHSSTLIVVQGYLDHFGTWIPWFKPLAILINDISRETRTYLIYSLYTYIYACSVGLSLHKNRCIKLIQLSALLLGIVELRKEIFAVTVSEQIAKFLDATS